MHIQLLLLICIVTLVHHEDTIRIEFGFFRLTSTYFQKHYILSIENSSLCNKNPNQEKKTIVYQRRKHSQRYIHSTIRNECGSEREKVSKRKKISEYRARFACHFNFGKKKKHFLFHLPTSSHHSHRRMTIQTGTLTHTHNSHTYTRTQTHKYRLVEFVIVNR